MEIDSVNILHISSPIFMLKAFADYITLHNLSKLLTDMVIRPLPYTMELLGM
jgi:hypothetical protein